MVVEKTAIREKTCTMTRSIVFIQPSYHILSFDLERKASYRQLEVREIQCLPLTNAFAQSFRKGRSYDDLRKAHHSLCLLVRTERLCDGWLNGKDGSFAVKYPMCAGTTNAHTKATKLKVKLPNHSYVL